MSSTVRAHFDGKQVVLDEPAPFEPGEKLIVSRSDEAAIRGFPTNAIGTHGAVTSLPLSEKSLESKPDRGAELLELLTYEQGVDRNTNFRDLVQGIGDPEPNEADLWTIVEENRKERRQATN